MATKSGSGARLDVYSVREFEGSNGQALKSWTRVGVAFAHKDTPGFNIELHALPLDGRLVALLPKEAEARASQSPPG